MQSGGRTMNGIIPLYKPIGMTSHDCVAKIRRIIRMKKVGHTGTLDPNVAGVLTICVGEATKMIPFVQALKKEYIATVTLGKATTTEDADGEIIAEGPVDVPPTPTEVDQVLSSRFCGSLAQTAPMYSAVKVNGKKLYEYARAGITVERPTRHITIFEIEQINKETNQPNEFSFRVVCSKGTYIRTLCVDIGKELGYPAHMSQLIRTESDGIALEDTLSFEEIERYRNEGKMAQHLLPLESCLTHLTRIQVDEHIKQKVLQGQKLALPQVQIDTQNFTIMHQHELLAIYEKHPTEQDKIKPVRVFNMYKM
jgi:tRNA pseudouridine55 synthase